MSVAPGARPLVFLARIGAPPRGRLAVAALAGAATVGTSLGLMATAGWLLARAAQQPLLAELSVAIVGVRAFGTARGFLRYGERLVAHDSTLRASARLRVRVFARLRALSPGALPDRSGDLLARFVGDVETLEQLYLRGLQPAAVAALAGLTAVALAAVLDPAAAVALAVALLVGGVAVPLYAAALGSAAGQALVAARGALAGAVVDTVSGAAELVAYGAAPGHLAALADLERTTAVAERRVARVAALGEGLGVLAHGLGVVAVLAVSAAAAHAGRVDTVAVAALTLLAVATAEIAAPMPAALVQLGVLRGAAGRITEVLDRPVPVVEPVRPRPLPTGPHRVRVRGAQQTYDAGATVALGGVDLDLEPGRVVALVGPSGAGKSTLAAALVRFVELEGGSIEIDGIDVRQLAGDDVRQVIGLVEQQPHLFHASLRDNLRLARPEATDTDLDEVAAFVGLDGWVRSLPAGWDTTAGEAGQHMSGGERRRLALARALLGRFPVLVLDEPTADVDPAAAAHITAELLAAARGDGRAVLLITHDEHGLDHADEVIELDRGAVVGRRPGGGAPAP